MTTHRIFKIAIFDMDGVIFREKNFWLKVHRLLDTENEGFYFTKKYLGKDYKKLADKVLKLWKGKDAAPYLKFVKKIKYVRGAKKVFKKLRKLGYYIVVVSSGSSFLLQRAMRDFPIDEGYANELIIKKGKITGAYNQIIKQDNKLPILKSICKNKKISLKQVIAVGDSENDINVFRNVGFSIAFSPVSKKVEMAADVVVKSSNLTDILKFFK